VYTTTDLLAFLKLRGAISSTGALFTTDKLLDECTATMWDYIVPLIRKARENYYQWDDDTALNATGKYAINSRASGGSLGDFFLIDASPTPTRKTNLTFLTENELQDYGATPGDRPGCYIKRNHIYLVPATGLAWSYLRQQFFLRPGRFVETTDCAQVTSFDTTTKVVTCSTVPSTWTTSDLFDLVQANPHFDTLGISKAITAITTGTSGTLTFSATLPTDLAVGDWISLQNETCIVQAPPEFHALLGQKVANTCLSTLGKMEAFKAGEATAGKMEKDLLGIITPRVANEGKKLVNRTGLLRRR
jgi:hypothetical protein